MKTIHEIVDLPDVSTQPLVHPLDIVQARRAFVVSWWLTVLALPTVVFGIAAILWSVSNNYVTPIVVPVVIVVCAMVAQKYFASEAWAYIPRKRQDRGRQMPAAWSVLKAALSAVVFLFGLVTLTWWLITLDLPTEMTAYMMGTGAGVVAIMIVNLLWTILAPVRLRGDLGGWAPQLGSLLVVASALAYSYVMFREATATAGWQGADILIGAAIIIGVQVLWWLAKLWPTRKRDLDMDAPAA